MIRFPMICAIILWMSTLGGIHAQQAPVSGFVVDSRSHAIRPINGLPGASLLGQALLLPLKVQAAKFSTGGDVAIVTDGNQSNQAVLVQGLKSRPLVRALAGAIASVDFISMNDAGTAAVVYSAAANQLQFVSGLPDQAVVAAPLSLTSIPGSIRAIAIAASGSSAVVGASDGTYGGIYGIANQDGAAPQKLATAYQPSAVLYLNQDQDVAFADAFSNQIVLIHNVNSDDTASVLTSPGDNIQNPVALQSANGTLFTANAGSGNILGYDLAGGGVVGDWPLPVAPTQLGSLNLGGVFVVNSPTPGPLYLFSATTSAVVFVPAALEPPAPAAPGAAPKPAPTPEQPFRPISRAAAPGPAAAPAARNVVRNGAVTE